MPSPTALFLLNLPDDSYHSTNCKIKFQSKACLPKMYYQIQHMQLLDSKLETSFGSDFATSHGDQRLLQAGRLSLNLYQSPVKVNI